MPVAPPTLLLAADGQAAAGRALSVGPPGLDLHLGLNPGQELEPGAALVITPEPGERSLTAAIATESGALDPNGAVAWITADWGQEQPLTAVTLSQAPADLDEARRARLKVRANGVWLPLSPTDLVRIGTAQRLTPVSAEALMVELVRPAVYDGKTLPGAWEPSPAKVTGLTVQAGQQPRDLTAAVGEGAPFFSRIGLVSGSGVATGGLDQEVNAWLARSGSAPPVPIRLAAASAGLVRVTLEGRARTLIRDLADSPDQGLTLPWGAPGVGRMPLSPGAELLEAVCTPVASLASQRLHLAPAAAAGTGQAQLCSPRLAAAQGFAALPDGASLIGIDVLIRPRTHTGSGTLTLHPDLYGRPAPMPYGGASRPLTWAGQPPGGTAPLWFGGDLPAPLVLSDPLWWLMLTLTAGECLWSLGDAAPAAAPACRYRNRDGVWLPPNGSGPGTWALARLRTTAPPGEVTGARLRRGSVEVPWPTDPVRTGGLRAGVDELARLNGVMDETLEVLVDAPAVGRVRLTDLRVVWR